MKTASRILVLGGGGREHALAWRLARDRGVQRVFVAPGNPGMRDAGLHDDVELVPGVGLSDHDAVAQMARREAIDLVVVGPEAPLVAGLADHLEAIGIRVFGPGTDGARLEASKSFCREIAESSGVPMADGRSFEDEAAALAFARSVGGRVVVKADGLAGGKGVTVCDTVAEAEAAIAGCRPRFGRAGERMVVERVLEGREVSVIAITDGTTVLALPPARDHKRIGDGDTGPNTGGMGAFSPVPDVPDAMAAHLAERFHRPILAELARRGIAYRGALYAGLMLTADGPYLLECNVRFGDPETQAVLPRVSAPLASLLLGAAVGDLASAADAAKLDGRVPGSEAAVGVVLAAEGYPERPRLGHPVTLAPWPSDGSTLLFWSGVQRAPDGRLVTSGGRVATVVGRGARIDDAAEAAYAAVGRIAFTGRQLRRDIGRTVAQGVAEADRSQPVGSGSR